MKKVMLFIASMLFAVSASAATLTLTGDVNNLAQVTQPTGQVVGANTFIPLGIDGFAGDVHDVFELTVADGDAWGRFQFGHFFTAISSSFSVTDSLNNIVASGSLNSAVHNAMLLTANSTYKIAVDIVGAAAGSAYGFTVATPIPAALFLFAPALLGFLGLRRRSNALVA